MLINNPSLDGLESIAPHVRFRIERESTSTGEEDHEQVLGSRTSADCARLFSIFPNQRKREKLNELFLAQAHTHRHTKEATDR